MVLQFQTCVKCLLCLAGSLQWHQNTCIFPLWVYSIEIVCSFLKCIWHFSSLIVINWQSDYFSPLPLLMPCSFSTHVTVLCPLGNKKPTIPDCDFTHSRHRIKCIWYQAPIWFIKSLHMNAIKSQQASGQVMGVIFWMEWIRRATASHTLLYKHSCQSCVSCHCQLLCFILSSFT